ncbi:MAG: hypothetical protein ACKO3T_16655 [Planctomycetaceae bacterium]
MRPIFRIVQTFTRLTAVLAVVLSAVFARPLHELEHAASGTPDARAAACSCGHLHGQIRPQNRQAQDCPPHGRGLPPAEQNDGTHSHHSCGICLAFGLQTPVSAVSTVPLECLILPLAGAPQQPQCSAGIPLLPPLRGPPAV